MYEQQHEFERLQLIGQGIYAGRGYAAAYSGKWEDLERELHGETGRKKVTPEEFAIKTGMPIEKVNEYVAKGGMLG